MILKTIDEYNYVLKKNVCRSYNKSHNLDLIEKNFNLTRNEILAILLDMGISDKELMNYLSTTNVYGDSFIVISDTHIGSKLENAEYLKIIYDFALKNKIKNIFHAGDLFQSTMKPVDPKYIDLKNQAQHLLDVYPESKNVKNHILFGNHDLHAINKEYGVLKIISSRKDFDLLGFKKAYFSWNKHLLSITHEIDKYHLKIPNVNSLIRFSGHRHAIDIVGTSTIYAPPLCDDIKEYGYLSKPGFLLVTRKNNRMQVIYFSINLEMREKVEEQGIILSKKLENIKFK